MNCQGDNITLSSSIETSYIDNRAEINSIAKPVDTIYMRIILAIIVMLVVSMSAFGADDIVHPAGTSVISRYSVNSVSLTLGDTLVINRTLINNSATTITMVNFSENVPSAFFLDTVTCQFNGIYTEIGIFGPYPDSIMNGQSAYHWVLDSPVLSENLSFQVLPSDSFEIIARFICNDVGDFTLPLHSTIGTMNGSAVFSEGDPVTIQVRLASDIIDDPTQLLPTSPLLTSAWPNPFNPSVTIEYETGELTGQIDMIIYDVLGRTVHKQTQRIKNGPGYFRWTAENTSGSGTYFYRLTTGSQSAVGTLLLIK